MLLVQEVSLLLFKRAHRRVVALPAAAKAVDALVAAYVGCLHDAVKLVPLDGVLLAVG